jgi:hypothetical protein
MPSISEPIAAGADDIYTIPGIGINPNAANIIVGDVTYLFRCGLRFQTIALSQAEVINSATISTTRTGISGTPTLRIYGADEDDAPAWGTSGSPVGDITKTAASAVVDTGAGTVTHDVTDIVQEIVDRVGWASGGDMRFGVFPTGTQFAYLRFAAYEHATLAAAVLDVEFGAAAAEHRPLMMMGVG